jgi:hypothetical protein
VHESTVNGISLAHRQHHPGGTRRAVHRGLTADAVYRWPGIQNGIELGSPIDGAPAAPRSMAVIQTCLHVRMSAERQLEPGGTTEAFMRWP